MADYYPLLARALDAMPDRSPALRHAVYERARGALIGQLRSLDPPLSEDDIDLERNALEAAIQRLEQDHGAPVLVPSPPESTVPASEPFVPSPANDTSDLPEPSRPEPDSSASGPRADSPAAPTLDAPDSRDQSSTVPIAPDPNAAELDHPEPTRPDPTSTEDASADVALPKATLSPAAAPRPDLPVPPVADSGSAVLPPGEPAVRIQARKSKTPPFVAPDPRGTGEPTGEPVEGVAEPSAQDGNNQRQRPRIDVVAPRQGRSRLLRNLLVGSILVVVIGLIAVAAFLLRDKPADLQPIATETQDATQDGADSKFADRVGGSAAPSERPAPQRRAAPVPSITTAPSTNEPDLAIAQRAVLYEENTSGGTNAAPIANQGRVTWRLDTVPGEQGQQLETVVRATADFPDAGLSLIMTLRRNLDATLPASHTIELAFTPSGTAGARRSVQDIGLLQGKDEEGARGSPVSGLPVRVRENLFLIGLSSLPNDVERNTDILLRKNWFDVTLKFNSGLRGVIALEKGSAGTQVLQRAFDQWR